jgi:hypothetical protein
MPSKTPAVLLIAIVSLVIGAGLILAFDGRVHRSARTQQYQQLVGGLGFGPVLDLSSGANSFDPRVSNEDHGEVGPIVDGSLFGPQSGCSIFFYRGMNGHSRNGIVTMNSAGVVP